MNLKGIQTRKANLLAGPRPPLPGQSHSREANLRAELSDYFIPDGPVEMIWIADIAYCMVAIEVIRARIAGFRMLVIKKAYGDLVEPDAWVLDDELDQEEDKETARSWGKVFADDGFIAPWQKSFLDHGVFAGMLSGMNRQDVGHLRLLEQMLADEMREDHQPDGSEAAAGQARCDRAGTGTAARRRGRDRCGD
ncbi:hypothetical protein MB02_10765 [Croceicoccus estronivorus]|nr:hypothetical protein MB02_10765 [Croceicoccus estronivorus]